MKRSFKYLLRPTSRQAALLTECLRDHCRLYNAALEERREAWSRARVSVRYFHQSAQMKHIRAADPDIRRWSAVSEEQTLRRLQKAFDAFFRRVKAGQAPGFPRFRAVARFDSVTWDAHDGAKWDTGGGTRRVYLQGIGHIRVHEHRQIAGRPKTLTVKREGARWYVVVSCDDVPTNPLPLTGAVTGIDLGVVSMLTTSEGEHVPNPRHGDANRERLAEAQRSLARCNRGSGRRRKAVARVARHHRRVRDQRRDTAHKVSLDLVRRHDVVCHESLQVGHMTRSAKGANLAQKSGLNRSILDAGWGEFLTILAGKAECAGREVIAVDPRNTSRRCGACGHVAAENRVSQAEFRCQACGHEAHADVNAAINILRAGLALRETEKVAHVATESPAPAAPTNSPQEGQ